MARSLPQELSYRRATTAALVGLGVQLALWLLAAALAVWTGSQAVNAAAWHLLGGALVWGSVWLIYQQHKLERAEALEVDELAADANAASMFAEGGQSLELAKKRLETLYRIGLTIASVTVAAFLLCAGGALLYGAVRSIARPEGEAADFTRLLELGLENSAAGGLPMLLVAAAMALVGFLTARYTAGMTRAPIWSLLRGGAAYLMGNVVVLVGIAIAAAIELTGNRWGYAVMTLVVPAVMVVLGLEILLSMLLGVYRPNTARASAAGAEEEAETTATPHPGERPRAAFDSRLLGWLTRPESLGRIVAETLNYQFGFDVSRSGVFALTRKALLPLLGLAAVVMLLLSSVVIVPPQQQAVVTQLGAMPDDAIRGPGVTFKAPWPFASVDRYDTTRIRSLSVGSTATGKRTGVALLWTNTHVEGGEKFLVSAAARADERIRETPDPAGSAEDAVAARRAVAAGLVGGELVVQWRISDLALYVAPESARRPERLLEAIAEEELTAYVAARDIDTLLTTARLADDDILRRTIQTRVDPMGIEIVYAGLFGVHPPQEGEVADAFLRVVNALLTQRTAVSQAETLRVALLSGVAGSVDRALQIDAAISDLEAADLTPEERAAAAAEVQRLIDAAGGDAARVFAEARADRWKLALSEEGRAAGFEYEVDAFRRAPRYFRARTYLDTLAAALPGVRKVVTAVAPGGDEPVFRLNLEDEQSGLDSFLEGN